MLVLIHPASQSKVLYRVMPGRAAAQSIHGSAGRFATRDGGGHAAHGADQRDACIAAGSASTSWLTLMLKLCCFNRSSTDLRNGLPQHNSAATPSISVR